MQGRHKDADIQNRYADTKWKEEKWDELGGVD